MKVLQRLEKISFDWCRNRTHRGIVLDVSPDGFDKCAATFSSAFVDEDDSNRVFLFYAGASDVSWSHSAIGLAVSDDFVRFRKVESNPVLEGTTGSFYGKEALTPAVTRIGNRFFMVFSGRPSEDSFRRLGLAWADDPRGPWHPIRDFAGPFSIWGNGHLENGPSLVKVGGDAVIVFYSNTSSAGINAVNFVRQLILKRKFAPAWIDIPTFLRRYLVRSVGLLKLKIRGTSRSSVEVCRFSGGSLRHLNGPKGSWNESVFCPGYFNLGRVHYLLPATSVYSVRNLWRQYIGLASSCSLFLGAGEVKFERLIDGPLERMLLFPGIRGEVCLDSPSPVVSADHEVLHLYYSIMDNARFDVWRTALTTFELKQE